MIDESVEEFQRDGDCGKPGATSVELRKFSENGLFTAYFAGRYVYSAPSRRLKLCHGKQPRSERTVTDSRW